MTNYTMNPIHSGTRLRSGHDVFAKVIIPDLAATDMLEGTDLWIAPADGVEVRKGDKWLYVTKRNGHALSTQGWTAVTHKGVPICENLKEVGVVVPPVEPPVVTPTFPQSFTLTDPQGNRAEYAFVRML